MLITQLKDKETILSLLSGKVFIINCHGCREVRFPEETSLTRLTLYDNPSPEDNVLDAEILFDDGSQIRTGALKPQGQAAEIALDAKREAAELLAALEAETEEAAKEAERLVLEQGKKEAEAVRQDAKGRVTDAAKEVSNRLFAKYGVTAL